MRTKQMQDVAVQASKHYNGKKGFPNSGKVNLYQCEKSHCVTITVDREPGVTPFMIRCPFCREGIARSSLYRVPQNLFPTHEWYRPGDIEEVEQMSREHVLNGGLLLRKIAV